MCADTKKVNGSERMKKILYFSFILLLIVLIAISSYFIYKNLKEDKEQENLFEELENQILVDENSSEDNLLSVDLKSLYDENNDIVGWISIDETEFSYPVMQTKNKPDYYLRRNFYKEYSKWGTPYLEEECNIETSNNLIIYGHHIVGNKMFGFLENYTNKEFYLSHKIINFYTLETSSKYEIFSVFKTTTKSSFKYYEYTSCINQEEQQSYIDNCIKYSIYENDLEINCGDKFITLSTCDYSKHNGRLVVVAKLIE